MVDLFPYALQLPILRFMLSLYATQQMQVCWKSCLSDVSNGVQQGSVLSPVLFAVSELVVLDVIGVVY